MKEITSIASKKFLGKYYYCSANNETVSERAKFPMGVALSLVLLPFFLSKIFAMPQLFTLLMCIEASGAALGYIWYKMFPSSIISCVPAEIEPQVPSGAHSAKSKKAA